MAGRGNDDALARQVRGKVATWRAGPRERCDRRGLCCGKRGTPLGLGGIGVEIFERELEVRDQAGRAFGAWTVSARCILAFCSSSSALRATRSALIASMLAALASASPARISTAATCSRAAARVCYSVRISAGSSVFIHENRSSNAMESRIF